MISLSPNINRYFAITVTYICETGDSDVWMGWYADKIKATDITFGVIIKGSQVPNESITISVVITTYTDGVILQQRGCRCYTCGDGVIKLVLLGLSLSDDAMLCEWVIRKGSRKVTARKSIKQHVQIGFTFVFSLIFMEFCDPLN